MKNNNWQNIGRDQWENIKLKERVFIEKDTSKEKGKFQVRLYKNDGVGRILANYRDDEQSIIIAKEYMENNK